MQRIEGVVLQVNPPAGTTFFAIRLNNVFGNNPSWILSAVPEGQFQSSSAVQGDSLCSVPDGHVPRFAILQDTIAHQYLLYILPSGTCYWVSVFMGKGWERKTSGTRCSVDGESGDSCFSCYCTLNILLNFSWLSIQ